MTQDEMVLLLNEYNSCGLDSSSESRLLELLLLEVERLRKTMREVADEIESKYGHEWLSDETAVIVDTTQCSGRVWAKLIKALEQ